MPVLPEKTPGEQVLGSEGLDMSIRRHSGNALAVAVGMVLRAGAVLAQGETLPPLRPVSAEPAQLLRNPGFEEASSPAWRFSDWPPRPETRDRLVAKSVYYADAVAHTGEGSLCFDLTTVGSDRILLAQQRFGADILEEHDGKRLRLSAWIWVARGPAGCQGTLTLRQWGQPGTPPLSHATARLPGVRGEWTQAATEFVLRMGGTRRADVGVGLRQVPDLRDSPVVHIDDIRLEVVPEPVLRATWLCGRTVTVPDRLVSLKIQVAEKAYADGRRNLRCDLTTRDGLTGKGGSDRELASPVSLLDVDVSALPLGRWAVRVALGSRPGERTAEVLLPFRKAEGPFAAAQPQEEE